MREPRFHLPEAAQIHTRTMPDGAEIRALILPHRMARANLLVLNGRADFLEKWADAYAILHAAGFGIASWDWRGQGLSTRTCQTGAGHIDSFDQWLDDFDALASFALQSLPAAPWLAVGHSMGAHLLLRWLADPARGAHAMRENLRGAALISPFFGLGMSWPLRVAVLQQARREVARGNGAAFAWGQKPYGPMQKAATRMLLLTASRERFDDEHRWLASNPDLAIGGVSWGWLAAFARSEATLESRPLETLDLPLLMLLASREQLVSLPAARRIASRLPNCEAHSIPSAAHELLREADPPRQSTLSHITKFADKILA